MISEEVHKAEEEARPHGSDHLQWKTKAMINEEVIREGDLTKEEAGLVLVLKEALAL